MKNEQLIKVLIADDQRLLREGLATLLTLTDDIRIVAQASNGDEAISLAKQHQPDVILMDIQMPHTDGVAATHAIHSAQPQTQIIMLTTFADDDYLFAALRAGACGYLLKDIPSEQLADAVRAAHRGESPITPTMARKLVNRVNQQPRALAELQTASPLIDPLSDREIEVLNLIAQGLSNKEIAEQLVIAEGTAKNHVSNILSKLDAKDRAQAVMRGKELGVL
ncbi:MAG: response regulator transcription factor [Chloroflexi bacterium]|nr:response regulator transcription factor [Chloroflexota bacterium]